MNGMSELPSHSSAVEEKLQRKAHTAYAPTAAWTRPLYFSIPGVRDRHLRILVPNWALLFPSRGGMLLTSASAPALYPAASPRIMLLKRRRGPIFLILAALALLFTLATLLRKRGSQNWNVEEGSGEPPTLVFRKKDLQQIWKWEIESGHYPSHANSELSFLCDAMSLSEPCQYPCKLAWRAPPSILQSQKNFRRSSRRVTARQIPATFSQIPLGLAPNVFISTFKVTLQRLHTLHDRSLVA